MAMVTPKVAIVVGLMCLLLTSAPVSASTWHPEQVTLSLNGAIVSSGSQSYSHSGGKLISAQILGFDIDPSNAYIRYSLHASIKGLAVSGTANVTIYVVGSDANGPANNGNQVHGQVTIAAKLSGMVPAETFPLGCTLGVDCTSAIPGLFTGAGFVTLSDGEHTKHLTLPMQFESAFLNPFGGPILFASDGGEIFVIATYNQAKVQWAGIQMGGIVAGTLGNNPVSGLFGMKVAATEDLRAGLELDHGSIAFFGMSAPSLNAQGNFFGTSTIPAGVPCPSELGFPPGTCQLTGFESMGMFSMSNSHGEDLSGKYHTVWTVPAIAFTSNVTATLH